MILKVFSLLDIKAGIYSPPFYMAAAGQAVRAVMELGADQGNQVGRHPADFQLVELGTWDDQTGQATNHSVPTPLGLVVNLVQMNSKNALNLFTQIGDELGKGDAENV